MGETSGLRCADTRHLHQGGLDGTGALSLVNAAPTVLSLESRRASSRCNDFKVDKLRQMDRNEMGYIEIQ